MSRLTSSFGRGYYGGQQIDPTQIDANLAFQAMSPYDRARLAERMSSPIYQAGERNRRAAEEQSRRFQEEEDERRKAGMEQAMMAQAAQQAEDAKRMDFQRQQAMSKQQAEQQWDQSRQQMIMQHNLGVMNADASRLDARDARAYQLRHPYLPGQSPYEQQDIRQQDFADQQEWQMAQKLFDQNIRKEDRYETLKNQHLQEGWTHSPDDQAMLQKLDQQVSTAHQALMAGQITKPAFARYVEMINKKKGEFFPTMPPQAGNSIANDLYHDEKSGTTFYRNKNADGSYETRAAPGGRGQGGAGFMSPEDRKSDEAAIGSLRDKWETALSERDPKSSEQPDFNAFLQQELATYPIGQRQRIAQSYGVQLPNITPQGQGNEVPPKLGGISRPQQGTGQSVPTPVSQDGGKAAFDQSQNSTYNPQIAMASIAKSLSPFANGSHPMLQQAARINPEQAKRIQGEIIALMQGYGQQPNEETWRAIEGKVQELKAIQPSPQIMNRDQLQQQFRQNAPFGR